MNDSQYIAHGAICHAARRKPKEHADVDGGGAQQQTSEQRHAVGLDKAKERAERTLANAGSLAAQLKKRPKDLTMLHALVQTNHTGGQKPEDAEKTGKPHTLRLTGNEDNFFNPNSVENGKETQYQKEKESNKPKTTFGKPKLSRIVKKK